MKIEPELPRARVDKDLGRRNVVDEPAAVSQIENTRLVHPPRSLDPVCESEAKVRPVVVGEIEIVPPKW